MHAVVALTARQLRILTVLKLYKTCWLVDCNINNYALVVAAGNNVQLRESTVRGASLACLQGHGLIEYGPDCAPPEYYGREPRDSTKSACTVTLTEYGRLVLETWEKG